MLGYPKIVKGERRDKQKARFSMFYFTKPHPTTIPDSERAERIMERIQYTRTPSYSADSINRAHILSTKAPPKSDRNFLLKRELLSLSAWSVLSRPLSIIHYSISPNFSFHISCRKSTRTRAVIRDVLRVPPKGLGN